MGQSVSFYLVSESQFNQLAEQPGDFRSLLNAVKRYTLNGTFMGITYLLKKVRPGEDKTIEQIFEPPEFNFKEEFTEMDPFYYHHPMEVERIGKLLSEVDAEALSNSFNAEELSKDQVYPWYWSDQDKEFLLIDYSKLKDAIREAQEGNKYLLCFIG
jgi:hypothetical protein